MVHDKCTAKQRSGGRTNIGIVWIRVFEHALYSFFACVMIFLPLQGRANEQMVGLDQNNTTVELSVGQLLQIELPGHAGSGLKWCPDELDDTFWELMDSDKQISGKENPGFVGNPYLESWTFRALKTGNSKIRLLYYRPWEGKEMADKSFEIKVVISP